MLHAYREGEWVGGHNYDHHGHRGLRDAFGTPAAIVTGGSPPAPRLVLVPVDEYGRRIGEGHPRAVLSDDEVELIRQLAEGPERLTYAAIAEKFETSKGAIHDIVNFRRRASTTAGYKVINSGARSSHDD